MALKTVTGKITRPDGVVGAVSLRIVLSAPAVIAGTQEIVPAAIDVTVAADGTWSQPLQANLDLLPATTYYTGFETIGGVTAPFIFVVPQSAGPFKLADILSVASTPLPSPPAALDSLVVHLAGPETITGDKTFAGSMIEGKDFHRSAQTISEAVLVSGVDATAGELVDVTLTANRVVGLPLNPAVGQELVLLVTMGGTGGYKLTYPAGIKTAWQPASAVGDISALRLRYFGTNWQQIGGQVAVSQLGVLAHRGPAVVGSLTVRDPSSSGPNTQSAFSLAVAAINGGAVEGEFWLPEPSGGDDAPGIQAILTALAATGRWITAHAWPATYLLGSLVTVPSGVGLLGEAGYFSSAGANFKCTAAGAGVAFGDATTASNIGPISGGFRVDGNSVATNPLLIGKCVQRTFWPMAVENAAAGGAGWLVQKAQNCYFAAPAIQNCAGDGLVLDLGCGGNTFLGLESNANAGANLRFTQSAASADAYPVPEQNFFINPRLERSAVAINHEAGLNNVLDLPVLNYSGAAAPHTLVAMTALSTSAGLTLRNPIFNANQAYATGVSVANGTSIKLLGTISLSGLLNFLSIDVGANVEMEHVAPFSTVTNFYAGAGAPNTAVRSRLRSPLEITRTAVGDSVLVGVIEGEAGQRVFLSEVGLGFGPGTGFSADASIQRNNTARLDMTGNWKMLSGNVWFLRVALTYGTTVATTATAGTHFGLIVTDGVAFTMSTPGSPTVGMTITYDIKNSSGGAMGVITWAVAFLLAGAFTNPANGKRRTITFLYDGTNWVEVSRAAADI